MIRNPVDTLKDSAAAVARGKAGVPQYNSSMGLLTNLVKLLASNPKPPVSENNADKNSNVQAPLQHPLEGQVIASETIRPPGHDMRRPGYTPTTNYPFAPGAAMPPPSAGPEAESVAIPWDFSPPAPGQKERELEDLRRHQETMRIREMNRVAPQQAPPQTLEEPTEEKTEFTDGARDLAEGLGLDTNWIVSVVEPSGKRSDVLVKDVRRAAAIRDKELEEQRKAEREKREAEEEQRWAAAHPSPVPAYPEPERPKDDAAMLEDLLKQSLEEVSGHVTSIEPD